MDNNPQPKNEEKRLKALKEYTLLDTLPEATFDRLTQLASLVCGVPISLITLLDENRQWFKSRVGVDIQETPRGDSFCQYTILGKEPLEVKDTLADDRFRDNALVTGPPNMRYYAGFPLIDPEGNALGALCIIDRKPNALDAQKQEILSLLAQEVVTHIVARKERIILENYEKLFLESVDLICVAGSDGFFRKINPAFQQTLGWSANRLMKMPFYSFIHPDDVDPTVSVMQGLDMGEKVLNYTNRFKTSDGDYKCFQWIATPDEESDNIYAIGRDITEFTKIQNKLAEVSNFQEKILNGTNYAIISTDPAGIITTFNRGAIDMLGYKAEEVIHKLNIVDFIDREELEKAVVDFQEKQNKTIQSSFEIITTHAKIGVEDTQEWTFKHKSGTPISVELTISLLEKDGYTITSYLGIARDVTARKAALEQLEISERRHRAFFENSQSLMCTHDLEGKFISINPAGTEMMGYTFGEFKVNSLHDIVSPEFKNEVSTYLREIKKHGHLKGLMKILDKEGNTRTWMYNNVISEFADGRKYVIGNAVDLTSRITMENELLKAKENAERNARAKDVFLANMSHEIRTPMNAIIGFANLLKDTPLSKDQWEYTKNISTASESLMGIINDVLDFSKIESGHLTIESIPFNLKEQVKSAKTVLNQKAVEKNLRLDAFIGDDVPEQVLGDPTRLNQILLNLINNALKFTEKGFVRVLVETVETTESHYVIQFSVTDSGIGISEEKLETIFERFTQADADTTRKFGGTGLGLSISKLLIEMQGGTLSVNSRFNEGSTFYFQLPFKKVTKSASTKSKNKAINLVSKKRLKILLVEDNVLNQRLAEQVLRNFGFESELAENGKIAVEKVRNNKYNLVLMDLQMPEMDGYKATETIRKELGSTVPIIAMTAHSLVGEKEKCIAVGMNDYLPKPFSPSELFRKITTIAEEILEEDVQLTDIELNELESPISEQQKSLPVKKPMQSILDLTYLKQISDNSKEFETEMISLFLTQAPTELKNLKKAIGEDNHGSVREIAHKLKFSYSLMGIKDNNLMLSIEQKGASASSMAEIRNDYEKLTEITQEAIEELKSLLQNETE